MESPDKAACRAAVSMDVDRPREAEGAPTLVEGRQTPAPILPLARQVPAPSGAGLDEGWQAGLLTPGSSYRLRLTVPAHSGFLELSSPVTAALPHRICTCFPILPAP